MPSNIHTITGPINEYLVTYPSEVYCCKLATKWLVCCMHIGDLPNISYALVIMQQCSMFAHILHSSTSHH